MGGGTEHPSAPCGGQEFRQALEGALAWLRGRVEEVNRLNVYPVPDGDTGTNMLLTLQSALRELPQDGAGLAEAARMAARGALMGARGNSGVIFSQLLRGFARAVEGKDVLEPGDLAPALREAYETAVKAVMKPVEGTILTVSRALAEEAERAAEEGDVLRLLARVRQTGEAALAETPNQLQVLRDAGVVDAGGKGLMVILEGAERQLRGESLQPTAAEEAPPAHVAALPQLGWGYDTQLLIQGRELDLERIRQDLSRMGDSLLVVGDRQLVKVHIHTERPGEVLDYAVSLGTISDVVVESMDEQAAGFRQRSGEPPEVGGEEVEEEQREVGVVAVVAGEGMQRLFREDWVRIVPGGQTMNPSTDEILRAIRRCPGRAVLVLPNNPNVLLAARQAAEMAEDREVEVIPTRSLPQGVAALMAFNFQADLETNARLMGQAASRACCGEVTVAVRDARVDGVEVRAGEAIGLSGERLLSRGENAGEVLLDLLDKLEAGRYELLTLYRGQEVAEDEASALEEEVRARFPDLEVELVPGGQPLYPYLFSLE